VKVLQCLCLEGLRDFCLLVGFRIQVQKYAKKRKYASQNASQNVCFQVLGIKNSSSLPS